MIEVSPGGWIRIALLASVGGLVGCAPEKRPEPAVVANPRLGRMTIAVAPALNLSGLPDFDCNRFADLMAVELGYTEGISVIPVSRVLGVLAGQGREAVASPDHARRVAEQVGADAILVFAVTAYDPYDPPSIGITAQLYAAGSGGGVGPEPTAGAAEPRRTPTEPRDAAAGILAQAEAVFDASHAAVVDDVREFAQRRDADDSPYGWRKYVVTQQGFIRYCCFATLRALFSGARGQCQETGTEGGGLAGQTPATQVR
ncbi:MAG: hypothetical protein HY763_01700 [Planctomycetes bacterium]|nr:hypothetical protein [Planctomycetota bacterium]